ncbi:hypothetical protein [Streptomyces sp. NPDC059513]|uniref:hypothetical protein n=1 Tax=unclassified Streptomyces TaxID=2593676 RepID=UPI0036BD787D
MALIKIEYPSGGGFEVEGHDADEAVALTYFALTILWGRKTIKDDRRYGDSPVTLEEIDSWLGK